MQVTTWVKSTTQKTLRPTGALKTGVYLHQRYTNPRSHVTVVSKFCTVTPNTFVFSMAFSLCGPFDALEF